MMAPRAEPDLLRACKTDAKKMCCVSDLFMLYIRMALANAELAAPDTCDLGDGGEIFLTQ